MHKGHYGKYTGNAKWSKDHAHTRVTKENYKASERDDAAHIDYLKRDVLYDEKHGHSDEKMTADEKHISKLAGDMKYDKKHHSPFHDNHPEKIVGENTDKIQTDKKGRQYSLVMENSVNAKKGDTIRPSGKKFNKNKVSGGYIMGGDYETKKTGPKTRTMINMNKPSGINHKYPERHAHSKWETGPKKGQYKTSPGSARFFKGFRPPEQDGKNHGGDNKAAKDIQKDM